MSKKQIIILIIAFVSIVFISAISIYSLSNKNTTNNNPKDKTSKILEIGNYKLHYGNYKGIEKEYDNDTETITEKEIIFNLSKERINGEIYEVKGMSLYVNGYEMYKVIANDKVELLAGEGVEFVYEGN